MMYEIENDKIGEYLKNLITEKYVSQRKFCQAYIKATGGDVSDDETRKMANRLSQIIKGAKAIQIYDLPIFTELLDATCEEILSAGQRFVPKSKQVTIILLHFPKRMTGSAILKGTISLFSIPMNMAILSLTMRCSSKIMSF